MSSIIRNRAATSVGSATEAGPGTIRKQPELLAQFPDLDCTKPFVRTSELGDGRILNQAMSIRLILGVGAMLVLVALVASLLNRSRRPAATVAELPAWRGEAGAPAAPPATTKAPAPPTTTTVPTSAAAIANAGHTPEPKRAEPKPAAPVSHVVAAEPTRPAPTAVNTMAKAPAQASDYRPSERNELRNYDRPGSGAIYQADTRNDVAAPYRPTGGYNNNGGGQPVNNTSVNQNNPYLGGYNNGPIANAPANNGVQNLPPVGPPRGNEYPPTNNYGSNNYQQSNYQQNNYQPNNAANNYQQNNNPAYGPSAGQAPGPYAPPANADPYARGDAGVRFDGTITNPPMNTSTYPPVNTPNYIRQ